MQLYPDRLSEFFSDCDLQICLAGVSRCVSTKYLGLQESDISHLTNIGELHLYSVVVNAEDGICVDQNTPLRSSLVAMRCPAIEHLVIAADKCTTSLLVFQSQLLAMAEATMCQNGSLWPRTSEEPRRSRKLGSVKL